MGRGDPALRAGAARAAAGARRRPRPSRPRPGATVPARRPGASQADRAAAEGRWPDAVILLENIRSLDGNYPDLARRLQVAGAKRHVADLQSDIRTLAGAGQWAAVSPPVRSWPGWLRRRPTRMGWSAGPRPSWARPGAGGWRSCTYRAGQAEAGGRVGLRRSAALEPRSVQLDPGQRRRRPPAGGSAASAPARASPRRPARVSRHRSRRRCRPRNRPRTGSPPRRPGRRAARGRRACLRPAARSQAVNRGLDHRGGRRAAGGRRGRGRRARAARDWGGPDGPAPTATPSPSAGVGPRRPTPTAHADAERRPPTAAPRA